VTRSPKGGFTIIEVLIAVVVLGAGVLALASSSAAVSRIIGRGRTSTLSAQVAQEQLERLRSYAAATDPKCASTRFKSSAGAEQRQGVSLTWFVENSTNDVRPVEVYVTYRVPPGRTRIDTLRTRILCE
jgi:prepilin-type N-terminal cleavage/methylation domain-containing protein